MDSKPKVDVDQLLSKPVHQNIGDVIRAAGENGYNILLGDTNHSDYNIKQFIRQPEFLRALAEAGVTKIYTEGVFDEPQTRKKYIDAMKEPESHIKSIEMMESWQTDSQSNEGLRVARQKMKDHLQFVSDANKYGIDVVLADQRTPESLKECMASVKEAAVTLPNNGADWEYLLKKSCLLDDQKTVDFIKEDSQGHRFAVVFGSGHMSHAMGMDEMLGERVVQINFHSTQESLRQVHQDYGDDPSIDLFHSDPPEYVHVIGENTLYALSKAPHDISETLAESEPGVPVPKIEIDSALSQDIQRDYKQSAPTLASFER